MDHREISAIVPSNEASTASPLAHGAKRVHSNGAMGRSRERDGSEVLDPDSLSKALQDFKDAGITREHTPTGSPSRKRQRMYGDR